MKTAKLSDVRNDLSRYVARVRKGERVRITVRGVPVADLVPVEILEDEDGVWPEVRELERLGHVRPPQPRPGDEELLNRPGPRLRSGDMASAVIADRSKR